MDENRMKPMEDVGVRHAGRALITSDTGPGIEKSGTVERI